MFKENALSASITFAEGMYDIEFTIEIGSLNNKLLLFKILKIVLRLKLFKKLIDFNFNTAKLYYFRSDQILILKKRKLPILIKVSNLNQTKVTFLCCMLTIKSSNTK